MEGFFFLLLFSHTENTHRVMEGESRVRVEEWGGLGRNDKSSSCNVIYSESNWKCGLFENFHTCHVFCSHFFRVLSLILPFLICFLYLIKNNHIVFFYIYIYFKDFFFSSTDSSF